MELRQLRYFLATAETAHFRRAAAALHLSQPTLSQQIRQLEKELGTPLFDRIGKRVALTAAGETLRDHVQGILRDVEQVQVALDDLAELKRGKVAVGVVQTFNAYLMPPILARYTRAHPGVFVRVEELATDQIKEQVLRGRLHLGISYISSAAEEIVSEPLFEDEFVLIASTRHRLARRTNVSMTDLAGEALIMLPSAYSVRSAFDEAARACGAKTNVRIEMNSLDGILATVRSCGGATVLPALALPRREKSLRAIRFSEPSLKRAVGLVWRRGAYRSKAVDAFAERAREVVREFTDRIAF